MTLLWDFYDLNHLLQITVSLHLCVCVAHSSFNRQASGCTHARRPTGTITYCTVIPQSQMSSPPFEYKFIPVPSGYRSYPKSSKEAFDWFSLHNWAVHKKKQNKKNHCKLQFYTLPLLSFPPQVLLKMEGCPFCQTWYSNKDTAGYVTRWHFAVLLQHSHQHMSSLFGLIGKVGGSDARKGVFKDKC